MLPKGSISQVIDYFTNEPKFSFAMEEALCDFFDVETSAELSKIQPSQMAGDFFNEWLVFDCLLNNKKTLLEEYLFLNEKSLSREYKTIYTDLILTNFYSLFRIDDIKLDTSLTVTDMLGEKTYLITERKATRESIIGNYAFWRIAQVMGEYQIVSADGFQITPDMLPARFIKDWEKRKIKFDPLVVYQQMLKPIESGSV
jgi:hypothetical protein